jgi:hypothetical protein
VVASSQISEFLSSPATPASILDKLVSAEEEPERAETEAAKTEQVKAPESAERQRDEQLLQKLTEPIKPAPEAVSETEPVESRAAQQEQTDEKGILDQLTRGSKEQAGQSESDDGDRAEGDSGDA